jgi:hypothetical protein
MRVQIPPSPLRRKAKGEIVKLTEKNLEKVKGIAYKAGADFEEAKALAAVYAVPGIPGYVAALRKAIKGTEKFLAGMKKALDIVSPPKTE